MKILYWSVATPLMVVAVLFAISNMGSVELGLWPLPWTGQAPVYLVAFGAFAIGFFAGGFVAWLGAGKTRKRARAAERRAAAQERDIALLRRKLDEAESRAAKTPEPTPDGHDETAPPRALIDTRVR